MSPEEQTPATPPAEPATPAPEPVTPPPAEPAAPALAAQPVAQPQASTTDILGIISLVCAFIGLALIGFILGLVGVSQAKKAGRSTTLSKIGWILNLVFMIIGLIVGIVLVIAAFSGDSTTTSTSTYPY